MQYRVRGEQAPQRMKFKILGLGGIEALLQLGWKTGLESVRSSKGDVIWLAVTQAWRVNCGGQEDFIQIFYSNEMGSCTPFLQVCLQVN